MTQAVRSSPAAAVDAAAQANQANTAAQVVQTGVSSALSTIQSSAPTGTEATAPQGVCSRAGSFIVSIRKSISDAVDRFFDWVKSFFAGKADAPVDNTTSAPAAATAAVATELARATTARDEAIAAATAAADACARATTARDETAQAARAADHAFNLANRTRVAAGSARAALTIAEALKVRADTDAQAAQAAETAAEAASARAARVVSEIRLDRILLPRRGASLAEFERSRLALDRAQRTHEAVKNALLVANNARLTAAEAVAASNSEYARAFNTLSQANEVVRNEGGHATLAYARAATAQHLTADAAHAAAAALVVATTARDQTAQAVEAANAVLARAATAWNQEIQVTATVPSGE